MTVCAAIKVLKAEGLLVTAGARGTFVSSRARDLLQEQTKTRTKQLLREAFERIHSLGLPIAEIKSAAADALKDLEKGR